MEEIIQKKEVFIKIDKINLISLAVWQISQNTL